MSTKYFDHEKGPCAGKGWKIDINSSDDFSGQCILFSFSSSIFLMHGAPLYRF
jgi:hypothetical protein